MVRVVKKPEERRAEIVKAARQLFGTKAYDETTIQDVMDRLDIAKGTVYHYFRSKEELLEAVIEDIVAEDVQRKKAMLKEDQGSALDQVRLLLAADSMAAENEQILEHLHLPGNMGMHARLLATTVTKEAPLYAELIRRGCEQGLFQTETPLECAEFILAGVQFLTDLGIYPWKQEDLLRRARAMPKLIEAQLKAPSGSFDFLLENL